MNQSEQKYIRMTTEPVVKLVSRLAVPTIISMLVTGFYNLADTFFVRQLEQDSMVAAVGIVLPLMTFIQAVGFFCGQGSGNYISRAYGRRDFESAEKMASTGFFLAILIGTAILTAGLSFRQSLAWLLGAKTEATVKNTVAYMSYILLAAPFMCGSIVLNNQLRQQGNAFYAMIGLTSGAVINLVLDPLLIYSPGQSILGGSVCVSFGAGMGVAGAACATAISQAAGFAVLLIQAHKSDNVRIRLKNFTPSLYYLKGMSQAGIPSLARQGVGSIAAACLNHSVGLYLSGDALVEAAQAALTGVNKIMQFIYSALIGFGQGFQPVCGFNYGAKKYDRVRRAFFFCVKVAFVGMCSIALLGFAFAPAVSHAVVGSSELAWSIALRSFRAQLTVLPLQVWVVLCNMLMQNIGITGKATVLAMARQGISFIPSVFIMPLVCSALGFGALAGLELSQAVADVLAFMIALPIGLYEVRALRRLSQQQAT